METCPACGMAQPSIKHIYAELSGQIKDRMALMQELAAALAAKEKAESALCLLRSEVDKAINVLKVRMKSDGTPRDFIVEDLERVHYSDAPCPHAEEAKRLEQFIEKRMEHCVSDQRGAYQDVLDEVRRRADSGREDKC